MEGRRRVEDGAIYSVVDKLSPSPKDVHILNLRTVNMLHYMANAALEM
jgi:hypothetical protein